MTSGVPEEVASVPALEEAVAALETLADLPVTDHPAVFESIHRVLRDQLAGSSGPRA
jgi:hypothetical protein